MSETYAVIYSSEALDDLRKIYSYIAYELGAPSTALRQVSRIKKEIRSLDFMPMRYSLVNWEPWQSMKMHKVPVDNYVIYIQLIQAHAMLQLSAFFMKDKMWQAL